MSERVVIRKAGKDRLCWTFDEGFHRDGEPPCDCRIVKGEPHVVSTIFPGHESGFADGYKRDERGEWVYSPAPVTSHFCLPCGQRWTNLRDALARDASQRAAQLAGGAA